MSQTAQLNQMSTLILDWIRSMDAEEGPTLREVTEQFGYEGDIEKIGESIRLAYMSLNAVFLPVAPQFLRAVFDDCVAQIDWVGIARQRMAETKNE